MTVETRQVSGFDSVDLRGVGDLHITLGDAEALTIEADDDVLTEIITEVVAGRLVIRFDTWAAVKLWGTARTVAFRLTAKSLRSIAVNGAGTVTADAITSDRLDVAINGSGSVRLGFSGEDLRCTVAGSGDFAVQGTAGRVEARIGGAGNFDGSGLQVRQAAVTIAGAGKANVAASETLDVDIAGAGEVRYSGDPRVNQRIGGFGKVEKV